MKNKIAPKAGCVAILGIVLFAGNLCGETTASQTVTNAEPDLIMVSDASAFGNMTAAEILLWLHAPTGDDKAAGNKSAVKVNVVEVAELTTYKPDIPDEIPEAEEPKPEWYEWVDPLLFLNQWSDWWMTETNATPVVLVLIRF